MNRQQQQRAGAGSQQIQVSGDLIMGITEERAVEIAREQSRIAIQGFTAEAVAEANARIGEFSEKVVNDLSAAGLLPVFADPGFQILLRKSQLHAASTSEPADHELLSKLLTERAGKPSKPIHMVVTRSAEVVEQIDPAALCGLTLLWIGLAIGTGDSDPISGLAQMDSLVGKILSAGEPPSDLSWIQRLDLMDCINRSSGGLVQGPSRWEDIFFPRRPGYVSEGIMPDEVDAIRLKLNRVIPGLSSIVVDHAFLPGRFRINAWSSEQLRNFLTGPLELLRTAKEQLPQDAIEKLAIQSLMEGLGATDMLQSILVEAKLDNISAVAMSNALKHVEANLPNLQKLRSWWGGIQGITEITSVGIAIAFSNAKRLDPLVGFPPLSELLGF